MPEGTRLFRAPRISDMDLRRELHPEHKGTIVKGEEAMACGQAEQESAVQRKGCRLCRLQQCNAPLYDVRFSRTEPVPLRTWNVMESKLYEVDRRVERGKIEGKDRGVSAQCMAGGRTWLGAESTEFFAHEELARKGKLSAAHRRHGRHTAARPSPRRAHLPQPVHKDCRHPRRVPQKPLPGDSHEKALLPIFKRNQSDLRYFFDALSAATFAAMPKDSL